MSVMNGLILYNSPLMLGFGVEIWVSKLKLHKVVRESLVIAHVKVPKQSAFSIYS